MTKLDGEDIPQGIVKEIEIQLTEQDILEQPGIRPGK